MARRFEEYVKGIPTKPYDLLREGLVLLLVVALVVILLAAVFSSPDYPTINAEDVANSQPIAYLTTCANILAGNSIIEGYGPPYNAGTANSQSLFGVAPSSWFGVTIPIDPPTDFIINPLERTAVIDTSLSSALSEYESATSQKQTDWVNAYLNGLTTAFVFGGTVQMPQGDYGPVSSMMQGMLNLGRAGLLEGALDNSARLPFTLDFTNSLLFFQDDVYAGVADNLNMLGSQWGVANETGNYPGAWWTWPYAFLYQIPPMSNSSNADIQAVAIIALFLLVLFFLPFIPILNRLPRFMGVYKLIWRGWYAQQKKEIKGGQSPPNGTLAV